MWLLIRDLLQAMRIPPNNNATSAACARKVYASLVGGRKLTRTISDAYRNNPVKQRTRTAIRSDSGLTSEDRSESSPYAASTTTPKWKMTIATSGERALS